MEATKVRKLVERDETEERRGRRGKELDKTGACSQIFCTDPCSPAILLEAADVLLGLVRLRCQGAFFKDLLRDA